MKSYIIIGPWTPKFWPVHGSLDFDRSMDPYIRMGEKLVKISFLNEIWTSDIYQSLY